MSIVTKTGDRGTTSLMYGRRVPKNHPRVEAYGGVDELNTALGVARAAMAQDSIRDRLLAIQKDLVTLMGELATASEDRERYVRDGYPRIMPEQTAGLERWVRELEEQNISFKGWATPGANRLSAAFDLARTICRRAERGVCGLQQAGDLPNTEIIAYLNRLADLLWLLARWAEAQSPEAGHGGPQAGSG